MRNIVLTVVSIMLTLSACRSSDGSKNETQTMSSGYDSVAAVPEIPDQSDSQIIPASPTTIKPNLTFFGAEVDTVVLVDSLDFKITLHIRTALPEGGFETIAEAGQTIVASPGYVIDENGHIDLNNKRNADLYRLRIAERTDVLIGKISLTSQRGWVITAIDSFR